MNARFRLLIPALVGALFSAALATAAEDDTGKSASKNQRVEGVIVKVEPLDGHRVRLTLNTAAVWRDYARDTSLNDRKNRSTKDAAKRGDDSVATEGQPRDRDTLVTVVVNSKTPSHKRFRAEMDEATLGANSIEAAREAVEHPEKAKASKGGPAVKVDELRKGLYLATGFEKVEKDNKADWIVVLVPVRNDDPKP